MITMKLYMYMYGCVAYKKQYCVFLIDKSFKAVFFPLWDAHIHFDKNVACMQRRHISSGKNNVSLFQCWFLLNEYRAVPSDGICCLGKLNPQVDIVGNCPGGPRLPEGMKAPGLLYGDYCGNLIICKFGWQYWYAPPKHNMNRNDLGLMATPALVLSLEALSCRVKIQF